MLTQIPYSGKLPSSIASYCDIQTRQEFNAFDRPLLNPANGPHTGKNADFANHLWACNFPDTPIGGGFPNGAVSFIREIGEYASPEVYEAIAREAYKQYRDPQIRKELKIRPARINGAISKSVNPDYSTRPDLRFYNSEVKEQRIAEADNCVFYCRRSGLQMFKNPALPYSAMLLEIPFSSFLPKTQERIFKDCLDKRANLETRIFGFYTALSICPVEFGPECKRPQIPAKAWEAFLTRNLHSLINFASWYMHAPDWLKVPTKRASGEVKYFGRFPTLRLMHRAEFISPDSSEFDLFRQVKSALNLWQQAKHEFDTAARPKRVEDALKEAVEQGVVGVMQYSLKDLRLKLKNFNGMGKLSRFDKHNSLAEVYTGKNKQLLPREEKELALFNKLLEIYEIGEKTRYEFILLANNPLSRNIKKLEQLKNQFVECWNFFQDEEDERVETGLGSDKDTEEETFSFAELSELHHEFVRWLKFHIEELSKAQNMMQDMEVFEKEEQEEAKIQEVRIAIGMPLRESFGSFAEYMRALQNWKLAEKNKKEGK